MGIFDSLGELFDPGDQAAVRADSQGITQTLVPGSAYWQSGNMGAPGQAIVRGGQNILAHDVSANFAPMQAFQTGLSGLGQKAGTLYQQGGPEAAAALAQAQADTANAGGGLGGLKGLASESAKNTAKVGAVNTAERGQFANEATQSTAAAAASKLQQTIIQSALNHANRTKNTQAQAIIAQEAIDQQNLTNALQSGANAATHAQAMGGIQNTQNQQQLGVAAASGILAAAGGAAALGVKGTGTGSTDPQMTGDADSLNYTGGAIGDLPQNAADDANIPAGAGQSKIAASAPIATVAVTPYGAAVETPEDAWYAALTKAQDQSKNAAAYQIYGA